MRTISDPAAMVELHEPTNPPEEKPCWWRVNVSITRAYSGLFEGTREQVEEAAKECFKRHDQEFEDESIEVESEEESYD
jgi:hypothetical protein